ncbi:unnamed protein product [Ceutorhynchus assimilis]|uniref:Uncharacterized protein n=1 Tax=Ceutorhynchus assimilis TaxID=467358 RepID=A0A9N9QPR6_9CUCU|nr:unnamed protein product [Ceutorhynchus assimilis]
MSDIPSTHELYVKEVCRVCLNDNTNDLLNLFETHAPEMLQFCGFLEVKELDDFPKKICSSCLTNVSTSYELKQLCQSSKTYFQSLSDLSMLDSELKVESDEDEDEDEPFVKTEPDCQMNVSDEKSLPADEINETSQGVVEEPVKFQCQKCRKAVFDQENDLFIHQSIHDPELICNQCNKKFDAVKVLQRHIKTHMVSKKFACRYCRKAYTESAALAKHIRSVHFKLPTDKKHACQYCGQKFVDNKYRLIHERKHTGEMPLQCSVCDKCFYDPSSFKAHLDAHYGIKVHLCPECGKSFLTGSLLKQHQHVHLKRPHICNACGLKLSQPRTLRRHQEVCFKKLHVRCTKFEEKQQTQSSGTRGNDSESDSQE